MANYSKTDKNQLSEKELSSLINLVKTYGRKYAFRIMVKKFGISQSDIARVYGISRESVNRDIKGDDMK